MNDIYPIQEYVETEGDTIARNISDNFFDSVNRALLGELPTLHERRLLSPESAEILNAAIQWKVMEKLSKQLQTSAEGWCEVYYRALKRRYEEQS